MNTWQDEWPKEEGLWWFYGWCFGKEGLFGKERRPELCLVEVSSTAVKDSRMYVTKGHFLYKAEGAVGRWQKAISPELPDVNSKEGLKSK